MKTEEKISVAPIPANYETGINLLGKSYSLIRIIEGGCLLLIFGVGSYILLRKINVDIAVSLSIALCLGAPFGALGIFGINDEALHTFIKNIFIYLKRKRIVYRNPRVRTEAKPVKLSEIDDGEIELLPREKVIKMYEQFKENINKANRNKAQDEENTDEYANLYFEDDEGIVEMPDEMLSKKELKARKKQERRMIKNEKKAKANVD